MKEIWKNIKGYSEYQISNLGRVKSKCLKNERILKTRKHPNGYEIVNLKNKTYAVHRLVAEAFIPNPNKYKEVNHKDENKSNNRIDNLEWCSRKYNCNYGTLPKKVGDRFSRKVCMIDINSKFGPMIFFQSAMEAERMMKIDHSSIIKCCKGKVKTAGGYLWVYADKEVVKGGV